eukprot:14685237-Alexandrium_andersonii.AAC.1
MGARPRRGQNARRAQATISFTGARTAKINFGGLTGGGLGALQKARCEPFKNPAPGSTRES